MICAIHQPQYLPWLGYFEKMACADVFVLLDNAPFKKNEWQNRNRLRSAQGWQWLTVPVLHEHGQLIKATRLNPAVDWRTQHIRSIELNYMKAPFFQEFWPRLKPLYEQEWTTLGELNTAAVKLLAQALGIKTRLVNASELPVTSERTQRLVDICQALHCDTYLAGEGSAEFLDEGVIRTSGLSLRVQRYQHPVYPQHWARGVDDFYPRMSVVDLIMNCGGRSLDVLRTDWD